MCTGPKERPQAQCIQETWGPSWDKYSIAGSGYEADVGLVIRNLEQEVQNFVETRFGLWTCLLLKSELKPELGYWELLFLKCVSQ
jgi:hypothetical protein